MWTFERETYRMSTVGWWDAGGGAVLASAKKRA